MFKFITLSTFVALAAFAMPGQATSSAKAGKASMTCCTAGACTCKAGCCKGGVCTCNGACSAASGCTCSAACCNAKMKSGKKTAGVKSGGSCCPKPASKIVKGAGA